MSWWGAFRFREPRKDVEGEMSRADAIEKDLAEMSRKLEQALSRLATPKHKGKPND